MRSDDQAMASLILAVYEPNIPFMGDEALIAVCGGRKYTAKDYVIFRNKILKKVELLEKSFQSMSKPPAADDSDSETTATSTATAPLPRISCRFRPPGGGPAGWLYQSWGTCDRPSTAAPAGDPGGACTLSAGGKRRTGSAACAGRTGVDGHCHRPRGHGATRTPEGA